MFLNIGKRFGWLCWFWLYMLIPVVVYGEPPEFIEEPRDAIVCPGDDARFTAVPVHGSGAYVSWSFNGKPLNELPFNIWQQITFGDEFIVW